MYHGPPRHYPSSRSRYRSRSYSPAPRRRDYSASPDRRHAGHPRSPRGPPPERDGDHSRRSYSPAYGHGDDLNENGNGFGEKSSYDFAGSHELGRRVTWYSIKVTLPWIQDLRSAELWSPKA
ncbi:hypothetical protein NC652_024396 [Populus alba x Populus x berolinensis]|nr:hypothetical protein NC652_024396 [Populus alba x Populus x berolinensis]